MILHSLFSYIYLAIQWRWNVSISRRPVQELWMYRSDILCCFWHPVTFSSPSSWFKQAPEHGGPGAGGKAGPSSAAPSPAVPAQGGGARAGRLRAPAAAQPSLRRAQLTHKPRAGSVLPTHHPHVILSAILRRGKLFSPHHTRNSGLIPKWNSLSAGFSFQSLCTLCCTYDDSNKLK